MQKPILMSRNYVIFLRNEIGKKAALKMWVTLTIGLKYTRA
jgi:hypothetical protein